MKILITGASGFVGKELVNHLFSRGHEVTVLSRFPQKAKSQLPASCKVEEWNPLVDMIPKTALADIQAVINLMGENISKKRWSTKQKEKIFQSRIQGTANLVKSIQHYGQKVESVISTSAIGIYPTHDHHELDEFSPKADSGFLTHICNAWEEVLNSSFPLTNRHPPSWDCIGK